MEAARPAEPGDRTGVVLRDPLPWPEMVHVARTAEDTGYEALFVPEIAGREAFATLAGLALATGRIRVGTGVITIWSRRPTVAAMAAATVHELSEGRMVLGVGAGGPPEGRRWPTPGPVAMVEAYVRVVRQALAGGRVEDDPVFGSRGFALDLHPKGDPPPVWVGALGDRMVRLAGRVADGVILNWCTPERVAAARRMVREEAERAGRDPSSVTVSVYLRACLGVEDPVAMEALRPMAGRYAAFPSYLRQFEAMGMGEEARLAAKAFGSGRPEEVPAGFVRALAVVGGRREALAALRAYRDAGADLVLCYPVATRDRFSSILGTVLGAAPSPAIER